MSQPLVRIIDDNAEARSSTSFFLSMMGWEIREYEDAVSFLKNDDLERPGCIILDVRMPKMTGLELQVELNKLNCDLPIIFLSGHGDLDMAVHALKRGADDFLEKSAKPERLQAAVHKAVLRSVEKSQRQAEKQKSKYLFAQLTPREKEVAILASKGMLNKLIADKMNISERTVKMHRGNLMAKLEVKTVVELSEFLKTIGVTDA